MSAVVIIVVVLITVIVVRVLRCRPSDDRPIAAPTVWPGLPVDGEPLTLGEQRALSDVETDSWIDIPEPVYESRTERGKA